ncbi:MAG: hypothetical protein ABI679_07780 [Gemmatimonadota bacterium]
MELVDAAGKRVVRVSSTPDISYRIDSADRIISVNAGWTSFARANRGEHLLPEAVIGRPLWHWIADPATCQIYRALIEQVRQGGGPVRFQFRCDAPGIRRLLRMKVVHRGEGEIGFDTTLLRSQRRRAVPVLDPESERSRGLLTICGWCMRLPVPGGSWLEIEIAIPRLHIFEGPTPPRLTHGICPACSEAMVKMLDDPRLAASGLVIVGTLPDE